MTATGRAATALALRAMAEQAGWLEKSKVAKGGGGGDGFNCPFVVIVVVED